MLLARNVDFKKQLRSRLLANEAKLFSKESQKNFDSLIGLASYEYVKFSSAEIFAHVRVLEVDSQRSLMSNLGWLESLAG